MIIVTIVAGLVWGLLMFYWGTKNKTLKGRIISAVIITAVWSFLLLFIDSRISYLENEKALKFEEELSEVQKKSGLSQTIADSLEKKLTQFRQFFNESESTRVLSEQLLNEQLKSTTEELQKSKEKFIRRKLTDDQQVTLYLFLLEQPKGEIEFEAVLFDDESVSFALALAKVFKAVGYKITNNKLTKKRSMTQIPTGINLLVHSKRTAPDFTPSVQKAFKLLEFDATMVENAEQPENTLIVRIGTKY